MSHIVGIKGCFYPAFSDRIIPYTDAIINLLVLIFEVFGKAGLEVVPIGKDKLCMPLAIELANTIIVISI